MSESDKSPLLDIAALARGGDLWSGVLAEHQLPRLNALLVAPSDVRVELAFEMEESGRERGRERGRMRMRGTCSFAPVITCQRCLNEIAVEATVKVDTLIVDSDEAAAELQGRIDVIVVDAARVRVKDLIEDDLILGLPEFGCARDADCEHAPVMEYPPAEPSIDSRQTQEAESNPFAVLKQLKH